MYLYNLLCSHLRHKQLNKVAFPGWVTVNYVFSVALFCFVNIKFNKMAHLILSCTGYYMML